MKPLFRLFRNRIDELVLILTAVTALVVSTFDFLGFSPSFIPYDRLNLLLLSLLLINSVLGRLRPSDSVTPIPVSKDQDLNTRLDELTKALTDAGSVINAIEVELQSRQELVTRLEKQKTIAERAIELSKEQVDAVAALLSEQVARQSEKDARREWLKDIGLFIAGILVSVILSWIGFLP